MRIPTLEGNREYRIKTLENVDMLLRVNADSERPELADGWDRLLARGLQRLLQHSDLLHAEHCA